MTDAFYMQLAINEAWKYQLLTYPNPPVGAVVLHQGRIVAIEAHQKAGTSHAEVLALLRAYETISGECMTFDRFDAHRAHAFLRTLPKGFFRECELYVTLEPCAHEGKTPSCATLLAELSLQRIVIATLDPIREHSGGAQKLHHVTTGVCSKEAQALIEPFRVWQKRAFVVFKLAQTLNGRIGGGYLSSQASLTHVHRLRLVCDRLLIGGDTVRTDRPRLDCRLVDTNRAPDVHIYTSRDDIDRTIPLFDVPRRKVSIGKAMPFLFEPSLVLVEGGEGMLVHLQRRIDWALHYVTPKLSNNPLSYNITHRLHFLHTAQVQDDIVVWSRWRGN